MPLVLAALLALSASAFAGPVFAPGTKLSVVKTEHFDIIFPERSRPSAALLSSWAEEVYDEVSGKLDVEASRRIPVSITPDIGGFNGYETSYPYVHIVLYDTSLDIGWTAFADNFRSLFLHELTHAISLQAAAPWASFLSGIFGHWANPTRFNAPAFMVEGVTVSFESADGSTGRANDPLVKERLRQDILENRFKSPIEASGVYDEYPSRNIYYEYGGLFNAWLQKTRGMESYSILWKAMGDLSFPPSLGRSLDPYANFFYAAFEKVYGLRFPEAWAEFRNSLAITGVLEAPEVLLPAPGQLARQPMSIARLAAAGDSLFWIDARSGRAMRLDTATMEQRVLFDADQYSSICDVSADGTRLLVERSIVLPDLRDRLETVVYDLGRKGFARGSEVGGLRDARFFRDGEIGISSDLRETNLVYASKEGVRTVLRGSAGVMYSCPAVIDQDSVALIVAVDGKRTIGLLDFDSGRLSLLRPEGDDGAILDYVRQISSRGGVLYFNYNSDDRFYKLGRMEGGRILVETADYSGGVFSPVEAGGRVYYAGRFSEGGRICRYPGESSLPAAREVAFSLEPFDPERARTAQDEKASSISAALAPEKYRPLAYANPFNYWYPYLDLAAADRSLRPFGVFYFGDPMDTNMASLAIGYDSVWPFADLSLAWTNAALPVAITAELKDNLVYGAAGDPFRQAYLGLEAKASLPFYPYPRALELGLGGEAFLRSEGDSGSPYAWDWSGWGATASASAAWKGFLPGAAKNTSRGLSLSSFHDLELTTATYKTEAHLAASLDSPSISLDLWGAWASQPILRLDALSEVFAADRRPAYYEYSGMDASESFLAEGCASYRAINQELYAELLGIYASRILLDAGLRAAVFGNEAFASAFSRVSLDLSAALGEFAWILRLYAEEYCLLDGGDPADSMGFRFGIVTDKAAALF